MSARRAGTLKRAKAVTESDDPHDDEPVAAAETATTSAVNMEYPATNESQPAEHAPVANDGSNAMEYEDKDNDDTDDSTHLGGETHLSLEQVHSLEAGEGDPLCSSCDEPNGNISEVSHRKGSRVNSESLTDCDVEKQDSYVSTTDKGGGRYRVGACNRRYANNRSVSFTDKISNSVDKQPSDNCNQYIDLCMSLLKPCCSSCCQRKHGADNGDFRRSRVIKNEEDLLIPEDPFRKRCLRACMTFVYVLLVLVGGVVTYSMLQDLVTSMQNPVRSIHYQVVEDYVAPGIAVYPGGAEFLACGHYYNNVVTSKVRLEQLDLVNKNCTYSPMKYTDPHYPDTERDVLLVRGPTSFKNREAIFLHFALEDPTRDFFTVSYFVFPGFDEFNSSNNRVERILDFHRYMPTFALSAGLRMWIKLIMSEAYQKDDSKVTEFKVEYSVVRFIDRRPEDKQNRHLFFIFFEWKNDKIEQSRLILTTTPWSIGAGLCGVFLTLHRVYQLAQTSYKRVQKDKQRRNIRKRTLRELRQRSMEASSVPGE